MSHALQLISFFGTKSGGGMRGVSCSLTGIDTSSISRHALATSSNTCALRTTRAGCCTGTISLFTDGCAVQTPSAPLGHCLLAENAVPSAELAVGFATKR